MSNGTDNFPKMPPYPAKPKATAERAVSPAESVQSIDEPVFQELLADYCDAYCALNGGEERTMDCMDSLLGYINNKLTASHAEGRSSALEELAKEKERADMLDKALNEWLDKTQWVQDAVQSNKFSVMYLGHHRADVIRQEFDKLAQPLQQEGGKDDLVRQVVLSQAAYHVKHGYKSAPLAAKLESLLHPSDNLQQASTAQVEPATDAGQDWIWLVVRDVAELDYSSDTVLDMMQVSEADLRRIVERHAPAAPAQATPEGAELPPLPKSFKSIGNGYQGMEIDVYTADQMRDYARAALAATTAAKPVAWRAEFIAEAAQQSGFTRSASCCNDPLKFCNGDEWEGNIEGFAKALLRLAAPPQQQEPICCNHNCNQGRDCPNR